MSSGSLDFATIWEHIAATTPDADAVVWGETRRSYASLEERAARLATALHDRGVTRGSTVGLYLYNRPEYLEVCLAAFKLRAVPVNVNFRYVESELAYLVADAGLAVLVHPTSLAVHVERALRKIDRPPVLVAVDDGEGEMIDGSHELEQLVGAYPAGPPIPRSDSDLLMVYTGGTTGMPKGVQWQQRDAMTGTWHRYVQAGYRRPTTATEAATLVVQLHQDGLQHATIAAPPLIHGTGLWTALGALTTGQRVVLLTSRSLDAGDICATIEGERAVALTIVGDAFARPIVREMDRAHAAGRPYDLSSLRRVTSSGAMWSAPLKRAFHHHIEATLIDGLSASEGAGFASMVTEPGDDPETARFALGPRATVLDDDGRAVRAGEVGRLAVGGSIPLGYRDDQDRTASTFKLIDGARYSIPGDYARLEDDGSTITLLGRGSVCINSAGEKIYPEEVEEAVKAAVPGIEDCVVVGLPDPDRGQVVCAVVAYEADARPSENLAVELRTRLRTMLAGYKIPRRLALTEAVLRSPSGKADYRWAHDIAEERSFRLS